MTTQNHRTGGQPPRSCVTSHLTEKGLKVDPQDEKRIAGTASENQGATKPAKGKAVQSKEDNS